MYQLHLVTRAWHKFTHIPFIHKQITVGSDLLRSRKFWAERIAREEQHIRFGELHDLEECFQFSSQIFGPHQVKTEILSFLEFAKAEFPKHVCEIGTADGGTNFLLSQALPSVSLMIGVDLYVKNKVQLHYFSKPSQQLNFINGSSYAPETVDEVKRVLGHEKLDLLFIDGDHNYEGVKRDFLSYRHLVREGGIIAFHDIVPDYLTRFGIRTGRWVGGVPDFWSRIKLFYPFYEFVEDPAQDGLGIGAILYDAQMTVPESI